MGQFQVDKIDTKNVTIKTEARVTNINDSYLEINNDEKIAYKYLVGADGSNSIVRRYLGLKTKLAGVAIQYLIPKGEFSNLEIFFDSKLFRSWYAWIFPNKDYVSIGYGYPRKVVSSKLMTDNFNKWLKKHNINVDNAKYQAFMINCDYRGFKFGNVFLVGDAAGLASGFTGEGIYQALVSGEDVAKIILNKRHKPKKIKEVLRERIYQHILLGIVFFSGPLRNLVFNFVVFFVRSRLLGKTLVRILT